VRIRELFALVRDAEAEHMQQTFDQLRALLAAHETGEGMVLRLASRKDAGDEIAEARLREEDEAVGRSPTSRTRTCLERTDPYSGDFRERPSRPHRLDFANSTSVPGRRDRHGYPAARWQAGRGRVHPADGPGRSPHLRPSDGWGGDQPGGSINSARSMLG
jgi:hypothetical protein